MDYREFIKKWKISGVLLAEKIGMPQGTFNNKFRANQNVYRFSPEEEEKMIKVLQELAHDINVTFPAPGTTYNMKFEYTNDLNGIGEFLKDKLNEREPG